MSVLLPAYPHHRALSLITTERRRQEEIRASGKFSQTCADPMMAATLKLSVLVEEVGEVARVLIEHDDPHLQGTVGNERLREELTQVAAVAVAWLESFERSRLDEGDDT